MFILRRLLLLLLRSRSLHLIQRSLSALDAVASPCRKDVTFSLGDEEVVDAGIFLSIGELSHCLRQQPDNLFMRLVWPYQQARAGNRGERNS